jgi:regulatory protein
MEIDWWAQAVDVLRKKFGALAPPDIKEQARRARFMQYRGFAAEHYQKLLQD